MNVEQELERIREATRIIALRIKSDAQLSASLHKEVVLRLDALETNHDNHRTRLGELEAAYGPFGLHNDTHNVLNKRLDALEKGDTLVDTKDGIISLAEHIVDVRERLEALEYFKRTHEVQPSAAAHMQVLHRLEALENFSAGTPHEAERERQASWHATYNAAMKAFAPLAMSLGRGEPGSAILYDVEFIQEAIAGYAEDAADRAHGPLEREQTHEDYGLATRRPLEGKAEYRSAPRPPDPTPEQLKSPEFEIVWSIIKNWDVDHGGGMRSGATGNDAQHIVFALAAYEREKHPPLEGKSQDSAAVVSMGGRPESASGVLSRAPTTRDAFTLDLGGATGKEIQAWPLEYVQHVGALVKAAEHARARLAHELRGSGSVDSHDALERLHDALKPFEGPT